MPAFPPVYSLRIITLTHVGTVDVSNLTSDLYIVRTVTVYNGNVGQGDFYLTDDNSAGMLHASIGPLSQPSQLWTSLHLCWPAGKVWQVQCTLPMDVTIHGYQLSGP